ncbi:hypothetical protein CCACVL1_03706 [Corchorus capsularis]|uniref:Uncharacterized protein n=1 Tax=Corchorus capsularis TaxID=210143 RepID=A0A1R3JXL0_COCAP|nr:hypothetical protein CCACVL1_03706 [Corchorus capsularis]
MPSTRLLRSGNGHLRRQNNNLLLDKTADANIKRAISKKLKRSHQSAAARKQHFLRPYCHLQGNMNNGCKRKAPAGHKAPLGQNRKYIRLHNISRYLNPFSTHPSPTITPPSTHPSPTITPSSTPSSPTHPSPTIKPPSTHPSPTITTSPTPPPPTHPTPTVTPSPTHPPPTHPTPTNISPTAPIGHQ